MPVRDLARNDPVTATPDQPLADVAATMRDEGVGSVIVEEDRRPVGIVTDRDIAIRAVADGADANGATARDVMTEEPSSVDGGAGVMELTEQMCDEGVRRIPVMEDDELTGIVTFDDIGRLLSDEQRNLRDVAASQSPAY